MSDPVAIDNRVLARLLRRVFPAASHVSVEPARRDQRLEVVYRAFIDDAVFYLRLAEEPDQDLTTDAEILGRLRTLGASVPVVVAAERAPAELTRSYLIVTEIPGQPLAEGGTDDEARSAARGRTVLRPRPLLAA